MVIVGWIIVLGCVLGGYVAHHGQIGVLVQIEEFIIIGGAAVGSFVVSNTVPQIKHTLHMVVNAMKKKPTTKEQYQELLLWS